MNALELAWGDFDIQTWIILAFAAISVLGGVFKKKKEEGEGAQRGPTAQRRPPDSARAPRPPVPPRPPAGEPQRGPAPSWSPRTSQRDLEELAPLPKVPQPRPLPRVGRPSEPPRAPAVARGVERAAPQRTGGAAPEREPVRVKRVPAPRKPSRRRRSDPTSELERVLNSRSGVQRAILLSEILAPPLALRENPGL